MQIMIVLVQSSVMQLLARLIVSSVAGIIINCKYLWLAPTISVLHSSSYCIFNSFPRLWNSSLPVADPALLFPALLLKIKNTFKSAS